MSTDEQQVRRLLVAIFPSRHSRVLSRFVGWCYARNEHGVWGFIGDRADDVRVLSDRARAWRKYHRKPVGSDGGGT